MHAIRIVRFRAIRRPGTAIAGNRQRMVTLLTERNGRRTEAGLEAADEERQRADERREAYERQLAEWAKEAASREAAAASAGAPPTPQDPQADAIARKNELIDGLQRAMGGKVCQRYNAQGNLVWVRVE